nr:hypothetical protein Iba_chr11fCG0150 [Ipomoea batatas]GME16751.1 hypothetical protein Iba_scaffold17844CG0650 [Ipomoea batatas]
MGSLSKLATRGTHQIFLGVILELILLLSLLVSSPQLRRHLCTKRVVQRRLSSQLHLLMHLCLWWELMRTHTKQPWMSFPMPVVPPIALLLWPRWFMRSLAL